MPPPSKRRKLNPTKTKFPKSPQIDLITFDPTARHEYLTGFHKRKQERIAQARETAAKKEREEKLRERRQVREQRRADLEAHVKELGGGRESLEELGGAEEVSDGGLDEQEEEEEEFVDEDKYTTVTVQPMEDFESEVDSDVETGITSNGIRKQTTVSSKPQTAKSKSASATKAAGKKKKKIKFRYESKAERQATRQKQKVKNAAAKARRIKAS